MGLRCCTRAFSSCSERGLLFIAVRGLLIVVASLVAEHGLQARGLSSCGARASLLRLMWDLPGPGLEPVSPALAGGFLTTAPPRKPPPHFPVFNFLYGKVLCFCIQLISSPHLSPHTIAAHYGDGEWIPGYPRRMKVCPADPSLSSGPAPLQAGCSFMCFQISREASFSTFEFSARDHITRVHFLRAAPLTFPCFFPL